MKGGPYRPGVEEKEGKLLVFTADSVLVLRGWPDPRAWRKPLGGQWSHVRPDLPVTVSEACRQLMPRAWSIAAGRAPKPGPAGQLDLPFPEPPVDRFRRGRDAISAFLGRIPAEVRALLRRFPERRWHVLSMLARCPGAMDLARSAPVLAWCLATNWVFHKPAVTQPLRAARALLRRRRRDALGWLGFPATEACARLFAAIRPEAAGLRPLLALRRVLRDPEIAGILGHLPQINAGVLGIVARRACHEHVTPHLLLQIAEARSELRRPRCAEALSHLLAIGREIAAPLRHKRFDDISEVLSLREELAREQERLREQHLLEIGFPPPPVPGTPHIVPLADSRDVLSEARVMHNCLASCVPDVGAGRRYFYRILEPERATFGLVHDGRRWRPDDLRAVCNAPVTESTRAAVAEWLLDHDITPGEILSPVPLDVPF